MLFIRKLGKLKSEKCEEKFGFKRDCTMRYSTQQLMQKELGLGNSCWGSVVLMYRPTCDKCVSKFTNKMITTLTLTFTFTQDIRKTSPSLRQLR